MESSVLPITLCVVFGAVVAFFVLTGNARTGGSRLDADERAARRSARGRRQRRTPYVGPARARERVSGWWSDARDRRAPNDRTPAGAGTGAGARAGAAATGPRPAQRAEATGPRRGHRRRTTWWEDATAFLRGRTARAGADRDRAAHDAAYDDGDDWDALPDQPSLTVAGDDDLSETSSWPESTGSVPSSPAPAATSPVPGAGGEPGEPVSAHVAPANKTDAEAAMADRGGLGGQGGPGVPGSVGESDDPEATAWRPGGPATSPPPSGSYPGPFTPTAKGAAEPPPRAAPTPAPPPPVDEFDEDAPTDRLTTPPEDLADDIVAVEPSVPTSAPLRLAAAGRTKRGKRGGPNEDAFVVVDGLLAVADGVGGEAAGQIASTLAVTTVAGFRPQYATDPRDGLRRAVDRANKIVLSRPDDQPEWRGMACTLDVVVLGRHQATGETLFVAHVGDSSVWLQPRKQHPRLLTTPHAIKNGPLLNAIGLGPDVQADLLAERVAVGDRVILASDGITKVMTPQALDGLLMELSSESPERAADRLVEAALVAGARDDTTIVVGDVVKAD